MKYFFSLLSICFFVALFSQQPYNPKYIFPQISKIDSIYRTEDINLFYLKPVQYICKFQQEITLEYTNSDRYSKILENNYRSENFKDLNKEFMTRQYKDISIFVDTTQKTPLEKIELDTSKISSEEYNAKIDSMNLGKQIDDFPYISTHYDGFPVTIHNFGNKENIIGFGNNVVLELEALDKENKWQKVYPYRRYSCGTGIKFFVLRPNEIATVFEPRISGDFHTRFRYKLGNIASNEFEGNINSNYINHNQTP